MLSIFKKKKTGNHEHEKNNRIYKRDFYSEK